MLSNNSKYTEEFREQTVKHIFETGKSGTRMKHEAIRRYSTRFDAKKMCEVLGVKRGSYYRWLKSRINREKRELDEKKEIEMIEEVFEASDRIWG